MASPVCEALQYQGDNDHDYDNNQEHNDDDDGDGWRRRRRMTMTMMFVMRKDRDYDEDDDRTAGDNINRWPDQGDEQNDGDVYMCNYIYIWQLHIIVYHFYSLFII